MTEKTESLSELLSNEYSIYKKLYDLSVKKEEVIYEKDIEKLNSIITKEKKLMEKANKLQKKRENIEAEDSQETNVKIENRLRNIAEKLKDQNLHNYKLIRDRLQLNNMNIAIMTGKKEKNTYNKKGKFENKQQSKMINHRA